MSCFYLLSHAERQPQFTNAGHTEKGWKVITSLASFVANRIKVTTIFRGTAERYAEMVRAFTGPDLFPDPKEKFCPFPFPAAEEKPSPFFGGLEMVDNETGMVSDPYRTYHKRHWVPLNGTRTFKPYLFWDLMEELREDYGEGIVICTGRQFLLAAKMEEVRSGALCEVNTADRTFRILFNHGRPIPAKKRYWIKKPEFFKSIKPDG